MSLTLNMRGHIDTAFKSVPAFRYREVGGAYVDGIWIEGSDDVSEHTVNLQPLSEKELSNIEATFGTERILDTRRVYVNDGDFYKITPADEWQFEGVDGRYKTFKLDNRPWNAYCKVIVVRIDDGVTV